MKCTDDEQTKKIVAMFGSKNLYQKFVQTLAKIILDSILFIKKVEKIVDERLKEPMKQFETMGESLSSLTEKVDKPLVVNEELLYKRLVERLSNDRRTLESLAQELYRPVGDKLLDNDDFARAVGEEAQKQAEQRRRAEDDRSREEIAHAISEFRGISVEVVSPELVDSILIASKIRGENDWPTLVRSEWERRCANMAESIQKQVLAKFKTAVHPEIVERFAHLMIDEGVACEPANIREFIKRQDFDDELAQYLRKR